MTDSQPTLSRAALSRPTLSTRLGVLALSVAMLCAFLTLGSAPEADAFSGPCPDYSIQDVFDDPNGNWDGDHVNNSDELYNGLNPCHSDTAKFCNSGGNPLCNYPTYVYYYSYADACTTALNTSPNGDYDGDGISNHVEHINGANPCSHPCPNPSGADIALNPNGSWDGDGISNAVEVSQGTNPCNGYYYNPCPSYSHYEIDAMPGLDWDGDGITNAEEARRGYNPCQINTLPRTTVQRLPHVTTTHVTTQTTTTHTTTHRLPHVVRTYRAPAPKPRAVCPVNYPYYHPTNGKCYANPVTPQF